MADVAALTKLIEPEAEALGLKLVRVAFFGGKSDPTLQVMAERPDTRQLVIADCEALSRRISDKFDEVDPIEEAYRLEVSSPGIDRPLTRPQDWSDWAGFQAASKNADAAYDKLAVAAGSGDLAAVTAAFGDAGKACGACHTKYRAKTN